MKKPGKAAQRENVASSASSAGWVAEMHKYFREHGAYRSEDMQRVLGDPRKSVGIPTSTSLLSTGAIRGSR